jgi:hypothetical protein
VRVRGDGDVRRDHTELGGRLEGPDHLTLGSTALGRAYQNPDATGSFTATGQWLAIIVAFW